MKKIFSFVFFFLVFNCCSSVFAQELNSRYFIVSYAQGVDISRLYDLLSNVSQSSIELFNSSTNYGVKELFAGSLDNLYLSVSDIVDIHMLDVEINLVFLADKNAVIDKVETILHKRVDSPSFFYRDNNTIYISVKDFTVGILGHEIGHFIVNKYFVVPPPEKMQEVLCGYIEYTLLKQGKK